MASVIRPTYTTRAVSAGCSVCGAVWSAANAQGVAARHCDATGHRTWVSVSESIEYGELVVGVDEPALFPVDVPSNGAVG